jgi:hypothetical protein
MLRRRRRDSEEFPVSVQFSDGRTAISGGPYGDSEPAGPILQRRGGGGTSHSQLLRETRIGIDGQLILDAALRSVQLWPEDDTDEPPD